jgi:hypothetical protein
VANTRVLNTTIPADLYERIKAEAEKKNISMASIVRIALSEYLENGQTK